MVNSSYRNSKVAVAKSTQPFNHSGGCMEALPPRDREAEDAYVAKWRDLDQPEQLMDVISAAIDARRPQLAARLVGLLGEQIDVPPDSPIAHAQKAARLLMLPDNEPAVFSELQSAWLLARKTRMRRIKRRMRGNPTRPRSPRRR